MGAQKPQNDDQRRSRARMIDGMMGGSGRIVKMVDDQIAKNNAAKTPAAPAAVLTNPVEHDNSPAQPTVPTDGPTRETKRRRSTAQSTLRVSGSGVSIRSQ